MKSGLRPILRTGGVAQQAVDAGAELLVGVELRRRLQILALGQRARFLRDDVGLDALQLLDEPADVDHQIALDRKMRQRFDAHPARVIVAQEGLARQVRYAVDHHAATAADGHPARPAEAQRAVEVVLDVLHALQHRHVVGERHLEDLLDAVRCPSPGGSAGPRFRLSSGCSGMGGLPFLLGLFAGRTVGAGARLRFGDLDRAVVDARRAVGDIVRQRVL